MRGLISKLSGLEIFIFRRFFIKGRAGSIEGKNDKDRRLGVRFREFV